MIIEPRTQALLLLTVWLKKPGFGEPTPLTPTEYGRLAQWLEQCEIPPDALVTSGNPDGLLKGLSDATITAERVLQLLGRSAALGLALEKWQRAGLWVITRFDDTYPARLIRRLGAGAPPVLFGCGNRRLLDGRGIAVVGSRDASADDLEFTFKLGSDIANQGYSVISGGARGVDETAMRGALEQGGTVVGVVADSLLRTATSAKYRHGLMINDLVLVSACNPEAGFDVGNAMARNKYIYCLADAAVVISASREKGGTWNGAVENLKQGWVPLWVKHNPDAASGNSGLVKKGGRWLPEEGLEVGELIVAAAPTKTGLTQPGLFDVPAPSESMAVQPAPHQPVKEIAPHQTPDPYESFLIVLGRETRLGPETPAVLQQRLGLTKKQLNEWLKRAVAEGKVKKFSRPVRYQTAMLGQANLEL
ncbi:MAG TPA: DNA-processing protein DprA [Candidatus Bathyarchaeia archaeon]|nr:DNA-processing protein DprA [Candidatus Bathyarchaeia archaeon]